jgi:hypothetical protein
MTRWTGFAMRGVVAIIGLVCGLGALSEAGYADLIDGGHYCSSGPNPGKTGDTSPGSLLSLNDVTLVTVSSSPSYRHASDCYGAFDPGNSSPANEVQAINEIFGPGFSYLDKTGGAGNSSGLGGFKWEVHSVGGSDGTPGLWTLTWAALNAGALDALPLTVDLAILLMGGNQSAVYLLSGLLIPTGPAFGIGTFDIQFFNGSANKCWQNDVRHNDQNKDKHKDEDKCKPNQPSISHITVAGRIVPTIEVPEPTSTAMFGAGVLGLWLFRRKRTA